MSGSAVLLQFLNGLAGASSLFLVAAGLSLIFGVSRIVNFAHGSLYMLGMYLAVWLSAKVGFWVSVPLAALAVGLAGFLIEILPAAANLSGARAAAAARHLRARAGHQGLCALGLGAGGHARAARARAWRAP